MTCHVIKIEEPDSIFSNSGLASEAPYLLVEKSPSIICRQVSQRVSITAVDLRESSPYDTGRLRGQCIITYTGMYLMKGHVEDTCVDITTSHGLECAACLHSDRICPSPQDPLCEPLFLAGSKTFTYFGYP